MFSYNCFWEEKNDICSRVGKYYFFFVLFLLKIRNMSFDYIDVVYSLEKYWKCEGWKFIFIEELLLFVFLE